MHKLHNGDSTGENFFLCGKLSKLQLIQLGNKYYMNLTRFHTKKSVYVHETERTEGFSFRSVGSTSDPDRQMDLSAGAS